MTSLGRLLRGFLLFGSIYLAVDGLVHITGIRLFDVRRLWAQDALSYAALLNHIYASFVFLAAAIAFEIQRDVKKYRNLIRISGIWALLQGLLLFYLSFNFDFALAFNFSPSLAVWLPFYNYYLWVEAMLLIGYAILGIIYSRGKDEKAD